MSHLITVEIDQMSEGEAAAWIKAIADMFGTDFVHECAEDIDPERVGEDEGEWVMPHTDIADARRKLDEYELERLRFDGDNPPAPSPHWYDAATFAAGITEPVRIAKANETVTGAREAGEAMETAQARLEYQMLEAGKGMAAEHGHFAHHRLGPKT